jgi:hypothetical protein
LAEKVVEVVTEIAREIEGIEMGEPFEEATDERECWIDESEWESEAVGDGEELFGYGGERIQVATVVVLIVVVDDECEDIFPTLIR